MLSANGWRRPCFGDVDASKRLPEAVDQPFDRPEAGFVSHFPAFLNPVTEVEIGQAQGGASGDLPEDGVSAETGAGDAGVEKGVDGGEAVVETVDQADDAQRTAFRLAEFDQPGVDMALQYEFGVLVGVALIHAAAGMAGVLVAPVKGVVGFIVDEWAFRSYQRAVLFKTALLAAVGGKVLDGDAYRHAGAAAGAVRPVGKRAAAPESVTHEPAVEGAVDQTGRNGDKRTCLSVGQVAAGVGIRPVKLEQRERQTGGVGM